MKKNTKSKKKKKRNNKKKIPYILRRESSFKIAGTKDQNSGRSWDPQVHVAGLHGHVSIKYAASF